MELEFAFPGETAKVNPRCDFCRKAYVDPDVQVELMEYGFEICPRCLLKSPKDIAAMAERRPGTRKLIPDLAKVENFRDLPGGITALAIASAYMEIHVTPRRRARKAA